MIPDSTWAALDHTSAIDDEGTKTWISNTDVTEVPFTAFTSCEKNEQIPWCLVVRHISELNRSVGQPTLLGMKSSIPASPRHARHRR